MAGESNQAENQESHSAQSEDDSRLSELLTRLIRAGNQLAAAPTVLELCRQAVETGLTQLGFNRMSIWLVESDRRLIRGTYGTDENGQVRDERSYCHSWVEDMRELELLETPQVLFRRTQAPLFNDAKEVVGNGEVGAAALWNGEEVIGLLYIDNLLSQQPMGEDLWRIFELYASTVGHLLSLKRTESALRGKEELLSQILDIMPVGVFVYAPGDVITHFNRAAQELWEFEAHSIGTWSPKATWVSERRPVEKDEWAGWIALSQGKSVLNQEVEIVRADGTRRVLLNSGVPLRDSSGALTGAVIVNQDITESKRREQQLEALAGMSQVLRPLTGQREVLNAIANNLLLNLYAQAVGVVLTNKEGNPIFEAAVGDYASLLGFAAPEDASDQNADGRIELRVFDLDHGVANCGFKQFPNVPRYMIIAPLIWERSTVGALVLGFAEVPDSEQLSLIRALADVAAAAIQRGQLYDEVTTQANRLDRVMESVNFGLILLDPQRRVVLANQNAQMKLAQVADVAVGEELTEFAGYKLGRFLTPRSNQSRTQEIGVNGDTYEITTVPVGTTGAEGGWLMVVHDVTRERAIQSSIQQHQRLAAVGHLAAGIAHDFNNIVAVIILYVQMLQRNPTLQEIDQNRLNVIRDQAQNASKLIRQILDFSRQTVIERQPTDLLKLLHESIDFWQRTLPESIAIRLTAEIEGPAQILAEASSIQQALTNLAVNARDAMPNGGELQVFVRAVVAEQMTPPVIGLNRGRWFEIYVIDNGEGIAPENLPHIFDPFFTTKDIGKGTGLGLAQVYGIVQQHGGLVTAQSEQGKGTSICLFLPALDEDAEGHQAAEVQEMTGEGSETILLVEDNTPAREATAALLEMMGYRVYCANDGRAGFELFHRHAETIQMVLSDLIMPEMGGLELYQNIVETNPAVCMMIMTGYALTDEQHLRPDYAAVDWLQKPFTVKQLTVAVRRVLDRAREAHEKEDEARNG